MTDDATPTRTLACERCGKSFGCDSGGAPGSCWCSREDFRLPVPLPAGVGAFGDCLCPDCLRAVAAELRARGLGPAAIETPQRPA